VTNQSRSRRKGVESGVAADRSRLSNHGFAASPILYQNGVVMNGHQDGTAFVVMLHRKSGEEIWRYTPAINQRSFSTPVLTSFQGQDQLILTGSQQTIGLDPGSGVADLDCCRAQ
jgi:outer membrane protein assembly factor BamB